jgi:hypothetical protein
MRRVPFSTQANPNSSPEAAREKIAGGFFSLQIPIELMEGKRKFKRRGRKGISQRSQRLNPFALLASSLCALCV